MGQGESLFPMEFPSFRPHWLYRGGHRQTLKAAWGPQAPMPGQAKTFEITLEDGDTLVAHDDMPDDWQNGDPLAILFHGLGGCHGSSYMTRMCHHLVQLGVRVWRVDQRGFGHSLQCRGLGHAGRSEDVQQAVAAAGAHCDNSPIWLFGFSMGGNLVLRAAGVWGDQMPAAVQAIAAVAPPIDLLPCSLRMRSGIPRIYGKRFVRRLMASLRQRQQNGLLNDNSIALDRWPADLMELDNIYVAPLSGFRDAEDYYRFASSKPHLAKIAAPTLVLAAADDPIVPVAVYDDAQAATSRIQLHVSPQGGHVGFFGRHPADPDWCWMDWRLVDWFQHTRSRK